MGVPVFPVAVPGEAVSPGANSWSFAKAAATTVIEGLVFALLEPSVTSEAVIVRVPAVLSVTLKLAAPPTSGVFTGKLALLSEELRANVSVIVLIRFQFESTAFTVTLKAVPAVCVDGVPVLPAELPGDAFSPGKRTCNLLKIPALTVTDELVLPPTLPCVTSEAVTVALPAVLSVTAKLLLPLERAAFAGKTAFASLELIATVSLVFTRFQLASTALTVTLKLVPEV